MTYSPDPRPVPPGTYSRQWRGYRRGQLAVLLVFVGGGFAAGGVATLLNHLTGSLVPVVLTFAAWNVALLVTLYRTGFWPCPRCGRPFHVGEGFRNAFARQCIHCGLPLGAAR